MTRTVTTQDELDKALAETDDGLDEIVEIVSPKDIVLRVRGKSVVFVYGSARVEAYGSARVYAYDSARVEVFGATVRAHDKSVVTAFGSAVVTATDSVTIHAWSERVTGTATKAVEVHLHHEAKIEGGTQVAHPPPTPLEDA